MAENRMSSVRLPFHEPLPIFDRQDEVDAVRQTLFLDKTSETDGKSQSCHQGLLITGPPGVGKTSLIEATLKTETGVLFCGGKYDQYNVHPLQGFSIAISRLCQILSDRNIVVKSMSSADARALFDAFSATRKVVSIDTSERDDNDGDSPLFHGKVNYRWGLECLKRAVTNFLEAATVALTERVALYLDDLQWADTASTDLFVHLTNVMDPTRVCLIGSCRSNHQLVINKLLASKTMKELQLKDLSTAGVGEIVEYLTKRQSGLEELVATIDSRTNGNPFHTIQFLQMLQDENYLYYSVRSYQWECQIRKIQTDTNITDNVVDVVRKNLHGLPEEVRHVLFVSSFVGSHADIEVIEAVTDIDRATMKEYLKVAATAGLINLQKNKKRFKFVHDRIQQEAYESNPTGDPMERERIHYQIGSFLLDKSKCPDSSEDWMQPVAVSNLNQAPTFITTFAEKLSLVDANCKAAKAMVSKAAFFAASDYLRFGLGLLQDLKNKWTEHYDRALEMTTLLAEMHLCEGAFDECYGRIEEVIESAKCLDDKLAVFCVRAEALCAEENPSGVELAFEMLDELGERYCRNPSALRVGVNYLKVRRLLGRKTDEQILSLPQMTNPSKIVAQKMLSIMGIMAFLADDETIVGHVGLNAVRMLPNHGRNKASAGLVSAYSAMCSVLEDFDGCRRFGRLAVMLNEKYPDEKSSVQMLFISSCFCRHLDQPIHQCLDDLIVAYNVGMRVGETHNAFLSAGSYSSVYLMIGLPLGPIVADMRRFNEQMMRYGQEALSQALSTNFQYALNLMGQSNDPAVLEGHVFNMGENWETSSECHTLAEKAAYDLRLALTLHFGSTHDAVRHADDAASLRRADGTLFCVPWPKFNFGLAYLRMARESKWRHGYIRKAKVRCMRFFKHWMKHGIFNIQQKYLLLQAELSSLGRNVDTQEVREMYTKSIRLASRTGFAADAAIASERCGDFLLYKGEIGSAGDYFTEAIRIYEEMGAKAKVDHLEAKHRSLGVSSSATRSSGAFQARSRYSLLSTQQHSSKFPFPEFLSSQQHSSSSLHMSKSSIELRGSSRRLLHLAGSRSSIGLD